MVTDFARSFAVFTYHCGDLGFSNSASIGFATTDGLFANHPVSQRILAQSIACLNEPASPWVNVVYEITRGMIIWTDVCIVLYQLITLYDDALS